ncbi:hypothetical protein DICVIV_06524 [Dictyocaulus viviparus]|uniref:Uncharacterized protein n=1 Tax=Dictyocaulus viviparus TaxID=29172 RepID=A0A0D8XRZ3_DICVI|nr:hypothetical protein DICVIV_06524 [Dictyocaulus viviparus]
MYNNGSVGHTYLNGVTLEKNFSYVTLLLLPYKEGDRLFSVIPQAEDLRSHRIISDAETLKRSEEAEQNMCGMMQSGLCRFSELTPGQFGLTKQLLSLVIGFDQTSQFFTQEENLENIRNHHITSESHFFALKMIGIEHSSSFHPRFVAEIAKSLQLQLLVHFGNVSIEKKRVLHQSGQMQQRRITLETTRFTTVGYVTQPAKCLESLELY